MSLTRRSGLKVLVAGSALALRARSAEERLPVYVVDQNHPAADDTGPGTPAEPFKTIVAAAKHAKAGDTVLIHAGIYREGVALKASGVASQPITFQAAEPSKVIMRGSALVSGWTHEAGDSHIYVHNGWTKYFDRVDPTRSDARGKARNQLFSEGAYVEEVPQRTELRENTFFIDRDKQRIHVWLLKGEDPNHKRIEVSDREFLFNTSGNSYIVIRGIRFEHGANAQQRNALVRIVGGKHCLMEDCRIEWAAGEGLRLEGAKHVLRRSVFNHCGEVGFSICQSTECLVEQCESSHNDLHPGKEYSTGWGGGGSKHCYNWRLVIDRHQAHHNNGSGIWFDVSNNECEVKNSFCSYNEGAGLFYEISYALSAHDNVMLKNGLGTPANGWRAGGGIFLCGSAGCRIERNLLIGNFEGFQFRDLLRATWPPADGAGEPPRGHHEETATWNHDDAIQQNVLAFNARGQVRGLLNEDGRMLPAGQQKKTPEPKDKSSEQYLAWKTLPAGLSLEELNIGIDGNVYWGGPNHDLFQWNQAGADGIRLVYQSLTRLKSELGFEANGAVQDPMFADWENLDLRVSADSPLIKMGCYPRSDVPGVKLGICER
jgi:hypothetical protein